ncbi:MAG: flagellar FliJ family protein [Gammaproteobacteria bacterium]|nr:flagellar FliJ family protein [Gammaproteobacteria bacterium]
MTDDTPLNQIRSLDEQDKKAIVRKLADYWHMLQKHDRQLAELESYRNDYLNYQHNAESAGKPGRLYDYRVFLSRLNEAIVEQRQRVYHYRALYEEANQQWMKLHHRTEAIDNVLTRRRRSRDIRIDRIEQSEQDEAATRKFLK